MRVEDFNLKHTIESGQFFRYKNIDGWYYCQEGSEVFKLRQTGNKLEFKGTTAKHIKHLFGLNGDYKKIIKELSKDHMLTPIIQKYKGLRLMNREPWETIINFQCSIMSNIPKIQKNMELISKHFGRAKKYENTIYHTFPKPGKINSIEKLKKSAVGFRAKYIYGANKKIDDKFVQKLKKKNYEDAKEMLTALPGIGNKVADCICLFSLRHKQAFPADVWIQRIMKQKYRVEPKQIPDFVKKWGDHAGYAQQFLYHDARNS